MTDAERIAKLRSGLAQAALRLDLAARSQMMITELVDAARDARRVLEETRGTDPG